MHTPVLLHEVIKFLDPKPGEFVIDGTVDGGGHATEIIKRISPAGIFLGIDWDEEVIANSKLPAFAKATAGRQIANNKNIVFVHGNYADLPEILKERRLDKADGLLLDLGFSSEQLENSGRGFSFLHAEPLLMTYDRNQKPVKEIINELSEEKLEGILREFGEERFAKQIVKAIVVQRKIKPIESSGELSNIVKKAVPQNYDRARQSLRSRRWQAGRGRIHPATRTFQALRIYANAELANLEKILSATPEILKAGGRIIIISFHSLEDRIVKNYFKKMYRENKLKILTKKPVQASAEEVKANPRSRSAKLRAAVII